MEAKLMLKTLFALITIGYVACQHRPCTKQSDCDLYMECCAKKAFTDENYCVRRLPLNELCLSNGIDEIRYNGIYDITCPCQYGLQCTQDVTLKTDKSDILLPPNPRCLGPPVREPNEANSVAQANGDNSHSQSNGASAYANS